MEAEAVHSFTKTEDTELSFHKGDQLLILNYLDPVQWYSARKGNQAGLVPGNYIQLKQADWYYGRITRTKAENILMANSKNGAFLVRLSESSPQDFSLSVKCGESVQHFRILRDPNFKYFLWQTQFDSLNKLVEHYKNESVSRTQTILLCDMDVEKEFFVAEAIYDFEPAHDGGEEGETELGFKRGELIEVFDDRDDNWWGGRIGDRTGFFPKLYVKRLERGI